MTLSEFESLTHEVFGAARADYLVRSHVMTKFDGMTAAEALDAGEDPKQVWAALAREFDVPESYIYGA